MYCESMRLASGDRETPAPTHWKTAAIKFIGCHLMLQISEIYRATQGATPLRGRTSAYSSKTNLRRALLV